MSDPIDISDLHPELGSKIRQMETRLSGEGIEVVALTHFKAAMALVLSATFQLAPGTVSAECRAWERHVSGIGRFTETSEAAKLYCEIRGSELWTAKPIVGQVIIFSVRGVDPNGAKSPWTGGP